MRSPKSAVAKSSKSPLIGSSNVASDDLANRMNPADLIHKLNRNLADDGTLGLGEQAG